MYLQNRIHERKVSSLDKDSKRRGGGWHARVSGIADNCDTGTNCSFFPSSCYKMHHKVTWPQLEMLHLFLSWGTSLSIIWFLQVMSDREIGATELDSTCFMDELQCSVSGSRVHPKLSILLHSRTMLQWPINHLCYSNRCIRSRWLICS